MNQTVFYSRGLQCLVNECLMVNPVDRIPIKELVERLEVALDMTRYVLTLDDLLRASSLFSYRVDILQNCRHSPRQWESTHSATAAGLG